MYTPKCKRRVRGGRCILLSPRPLEISKSIAHECCERMELGMCPLFQEQVDPAVLADSAKAYYSLYKGGTPPSEASASR